MVNTLFVEIFAFDLRILYKTQAGKIFVKWRCFIVSRTTADDRLLSECAICAINSVSQHLLKVENLWQDTSTHNSR